MKKILIFILRKISRIIFWITPSEFNTPRKNRLEIKLDENLGEETFNHFKEHIKKSVVINDNLKIREYAIKTALINDKNKEYFYIEFGTFKGASANFFSKFINKFYTFDSFEGLRNDWVGTKLPKGHFNLDKKTLKLNSNVEPIVGWVEDTLDDFLIKNNPKINFVHMDMDTYSSTKFTLEKINLI